MGFRYPAEIISHYVWFYHRFPLSWTPACPLVVGQVAVPYGNCTEPSNAQAGGT